SHSSRAVQALGSNSPLASKSVSGKESIPRGTAAFNSCGVMALCISRACKPYNAQGRATKNGGTMRTILTALFMVFASAASAQDFPNRTIRVLVGFPAGGPSDVPARIIAEKLRVALGQPVIVENKTGAAGMIALNEMLAQPRDGHTLLLCSYIDAINPLLYKKVAYKLEDVAPVSLIQKAYYAFTIPAEYPASDLKGFIAHAKA